MDDQTTGTGSAARGTLFTRGQWIAVVVVAFFAASLTLNLALYLAGRSARAGMRRGIETGYVVLVDGEGRKCGSLGALDGGGLILEHPQTGARVVLSTGGGTPSLVLVDTQGRHRAALALQEDGEARMKFADGQEKTLWSAP